MTIFEPWIGFIRETLDRLVAATPFGGLFDMDDIAFTISALFVEVERMSDLDPERSRDTVYDTMQVLAAALQAVIGEPE